MYQVRTLNEISPIVQETLTGDLFTLDTQIESPDALLVRSAQVEQRTLPDSVLAIVRAGIGVNNIDVDACTQTGIAVFNTPGANANAVKELVLASIYLSARNIVPAVAWVNTLKDQGDQVPKLVESGKNQFVGPEVLGKRLGVVGLGAVGVMVANAAYAIGMEVVGNDPYISVDSAWHLSRAVAHEPNLESMVSRCDYISLHAPLADETRSQFNAEMLAKCKPGVRILNFARGELVSTPDMIKALESGQVAYYVTDFPQADLIGVPHVLCIPHLGASTPESEENCAMMAARQLKKFLLEGTIQNSVNFPNCQMDRSAPYRLTVAHQNKTNMVGQITGILASSELNIANMINKSRGSIAYTMIDLDDEPSQENIDAVQQIGGVIRVRLIK